MRFLGFILLDSNLRFFEDYRLKPQALLLLTMMAGWMNRQQQRVIEYLVEENRVLREQLDVHAKGKRIRFNAKQRRRLAKKGRRLGRKTLMEIASLVTPETIYAWHRKFVAMKHALKGRDHSAAKARRPRPAISTWMSVRPLISLPPSLQENQESSEGCPARAAKQRFDSACQTVPE